PSRAGPARETDAIGGRFRIDPCDDGITLRRRRQHELLRGDIRWHRCRDGRLPSTGRETYDREGRIDHQSVQIGVNRDRNRRRTREVALLPSSPVPRGRTDASSGAPVRNQGFTLRSERQVVFVHVGVANIAEWTPGSAVPKRGENARASDLRVSPSDYRVAGGEPNERRPGDRARAGCSNRRYRGVPSRSVPRRNVDRRASGRSKLSESDDRMVLGVEDQGVSRRGIGCVWKDFQRIPALAVQSGDPKAIATPVARGNALGEAQDWLRRSGNRQRGLGLRRRRRKPYPIGNGP